MQDKRPPLSQHRVVFVHGVLFAHSALLTLSWQPSSCVRLSLERTVSDIHTLARRLRGAVRAWSAMCSFAYALAGLLAACGSLASAQDLPPITLSGQSSGPAAVYTGAGAGTQDATCDAHGPRKQCGARLLQR